MEVLYRSATDLQLYFEDPLLKRLDHRTMAKEKVPFT